MNHAGLGYDVCGCYTLIIFRNILEKEKMKIVKVFIRGIVKVVSGKRFQNFWKEVYNISLVGMNLGGGGVL